jgi:hypothetical protein
MSRYTFTIPEVLDLLVQGPTHIADITSALSPEQLHLSPEPGEWSANEVLAHLRSCSDVWGNCMVQILDEDINTIKAINPRTWIKSTDYPEQRFTQSFAAFKTQRTELLQGLSPLTDAQWNRSVLVTGAGKPLERSVLFYAQWLAGHERTHFRQFKKIVRLLKVNETI